MASDDVFDFSIIVWRMFKERSDDLLTQFVARSSRESW